MTLDDLQAAYNGESNAKAKYLAFAQTADAEGYGAVASLFRAAAAAEEIHATAHARVIRSLGAQPQAEIHTPQPQSTPQNLQAAIEGETYEFKTMYPEFIARARTAGQKAAVRSFEDAMAAEVEHARLYGQALANLAQWKGPARDFWVCPVCGYTTDSAPQADCPVCNAKKEKFRVVR